MSTAVFAIGTRIVTGLGSLASLPDLIAEIGGKRIVVIADRGLVATGTLDAVKAAAEGLPEAHTVLVDPNPSLDDAEAASLECVALGADTVIAVGGGSALCAAKAVAVRLTNPGPLLDYEGVDRVPRRAAPTIAIPTTAGSGSEVSNAIVLHQPGRPREIVIRGRGCEPTVALLDASLMSRLPRAPMLFAAIDALSHGIESVWVRRRSSFTDYLAESAVEAILADLAPALEDRDPAVLQRLLDAGCAANLACGNTGLGLIHALSCAPTVTLPHGYQNGALLLHVGRFNRDAMDPRHAAYLDPIEELFDRIGFTGRFGPDELPPSAADAMVAASASHPFRLNNIRESSDEDLRAILEAAGVPSD